MPEKKIDEKLRQRNVTLPPKALYWLLMQVIKLLNKWNHATFTYRAYPAQEPGPIVMIANHASRVDYQFTAPACYPKRLNFVVGYNEFFRFPTNLILPAMGVIPKKNFTPDTYALRQMLRVVRQGGSLCLMPEGMSSITGMAQPVIPGAGKLLKKLGLPVYYSKISGAYLTYTKHCLEERRGRIDVTVDRMFTAEQLKEMSPEEIEDTMNRLLAHDDYLWNKKVQASYQGRGQMAKNLGALLYRCPACDAVYRMESRGNQMRCTACGNTVELDESYNLRPVGRSRCPKLVTDWTIWERQRAAQEVAKTNFSYSGQVRVGILPETKPLKGNATSVICGQGVLTLDHEGLHFDGILQDQPFAFHVPALQLLTFGMCTDISRFYTFVDGRFLEFYPENGDVLLWDHLTEELHRFSGGKWQNTSYRHIEP